MEVFKSIPGFNGQSSLSTWIYRIAITKCLDEIKKRKRKKRIAQFSKFFGLEFISSNLAGGQRPDEALQNKEGMHALMAALESLPQNQRIALSLSKLDDHTNQEVAKIMDLSLTAADALIYRAKQNLKKNFQNQAPDSGKKGV